MIATDFITAEQVGEILHTNSLKVVKRELKKALHIENSGVFKFGKEYKVDKPLYLKYLLNRNKDIKCEKQQTKQQEYINEEMSGGCLIPKEESNIANQLTNRIKKKQ